MISFGERLKILRKNKCFTQEQLAKEIFINKSSISRYEKNIQIPELDVLIKLAEYFNVSIDYLLGRTNKTNSNLKSNEEYPYNLTPAELNILLKKLKSVHIDVDELIKKCKIESKTKAMK